MEQRSPIPWCDRRRTYCASGCTVRDKFSNSGACDWESRISLAPYVPQPGDYEPQPRSLQHPPQQRQQHQNGQQNRGGGQDQQQFRSKYGPGHQNHKKGRNGQQQRPNQNQPRHQQGGNSGNNGNGNGNGEQPPAAAAAGAEPVQQPETFAAPARDTQANSEPVVIVVPESSDND